MRAWIWIAGIVVVSLVGGQADAVTVMIGADQDVTIIEDPSGQLSGARSAELAVGRSDGGKLHRALIRFPVWRHVPRGSVIRKARLVMWANSARQETVALHRLEKAWGEGGADLATGMDTAVSGDATWLHGMYDSEVWAEPGGDFADTSSVEMTLSNDSVVGAESGNLTSDVQAWALDPAANYGWILRAANETSPGLSRLSSRDHPEGGRRPMLLVDYAFLGSGILIGDPDLAASGAGGGSSGVTGNEVEKYGFIVVGDSTNAEETYLLFGDTLVDSVSWTMDSKYVFSAEGVQTAMPLTVAVTNQNGESAPPGIPVALSINKGRLEGTGLFRAVLRTGQNEGGRFYFRTDERGEIKALFRTPQVTPLPFSALRAGWAHAETEEETWTRYDKSNRLVSADINTEGFANEVGFTAVTNDSTSFVRSPIPARTGSELPVLVGPDHVRMTTGKDGDFFVFAAEGVVPAETPLTVDVKDSRGRPVPDGTPIMVSLKWGAMASHGEIRRWVPPDTPRAGGGQFFYRTERGAITGTYIAPSMLPPTYWAELKRNFGTEFTEEALWERFQNENRVPSMTSEQGSRVWSVRFTDLADTTSALPHDALLLQPESTPPVLVGPDSVWVSTEGPRPNDVTVFTHREVTERAKVHVEAFDSRGARVPEGTPLGFVPGRFLFRPDTDIRGLLEGSSVIRRSNFTYAVTDARGHIDMRYDPKGVEILPFSHREGWTRDEYGIDEWGMETSVWPVRFIVPNDLSTASHVSLSSNETSPLSVADDSSFPVRIGPDRATVSFKYPVLEAGWITSPVTIVLLDTEGEPVRRGTRVWIEVDDGTIDRSAGNSFYVRRDDGVIHATYRSPTRRLLSELKIDLRVVLEGFDPQLVLGTGSILLRGGAVNFDNPDVIRLVTGVKASTVWQGVLNVLNVGKNIFQIADAVDEAQQARQALEDINFETSDIEAKYSGYLQGMARTRDAIAKVAATQPGTSFTGPNLGAGNWQSQISKVGIKKTVVSTVKSKIDPRSTIRSSAKGTVKKHIRSKGLAQGRQDSASSKQSLFTPLQSFGDPVLDADLDWLAGSNGTHALFSLGMRFDGVDGAAANGVLEIGDQVLLQPDFLPEEVTGSVDPTGAARTLGFLEILSVDPESDGIQAMAWGIVSAATDASPLYPFQVKVGSSGGRITSEDGIDIDIPSGVVSDSTEFFLMEIAPPAPVIDDVGLIIDRAFVFAAVDPTSSDLKVIEMALTTPAEVTVHSTGERTVEGTPHLFQDDGSWIHGSITTADSTQTFMLSSTGVFGFASTGRLPEIAPDPVPEPTAPSPDFDGDGSVGFSDFLAFAGAFGKSQTSPDFEAKFDLDEDGTIGFQDFLAFAAAFGS